MWRGLQMGSETKRSAGQPIPRGLSNIGPVYNGEKTLRQALVAIRAAVGALRSAHPDMETEILVIDDGSTDATVFVAASAGCAVLSFPVNRGLSEARNHGV